MLDGVRKALTSPSAFSRLVPTRALRTYQAHAANAINDHINNPTADNLMVLLFSRQAGKDELIAQLVTYLLMRHSRTGGSIVIATPTREPQGQIAFSRALAYAQAHPFTRKLVRSSGGYQIHIGNAKASYMSAVSDSARGQTASIALIANEAQSIDPQVWDAVFDPMAASTNAPTIFSGTIWTPDTLLSRQMRYAHELEVDGRQRVHKVPWRTVADELPAYGERVQARIKQLGANHPFIRTEYELIELDSAATMFNEQRLAQLEGSHPRKRSRTDNTPVIFLVDVAGADEAIEGAPTDPDSARDSTVLTIIEVEHIDALPHYRVINRMAWQNVAWVTIENAITDQMEQWSPTHTIIDATGIGHGMWQRLTSRNPRSKIVPFTFTSSSKSNIGWATLGVIDSGRIKEYAQDDEPDTNEHWWQMRHLTSSVRSESSRILTYGIPAGVGHDDYVLSFMLLGFVDAELDLRPRTARGS